MIDPKSITTYSQYNEDLILLALFKDTDIGFYVDVGANYPTIDSVTKLFYDKGWRGINIEPIKSLHRQLQQARPRDINLQCGAGKKNSTAILREYVNMSGHSTFDSAQKKQHNASVKYVDYEVPIRTLKEVFIEYRVGHIHFIKIDVEGFEYEVVAGNDWEKYHPEVVSIEANHVSHDWREVLIKNGYKLFITDGLNEYYVAKKSWQRTEGFAERIVKIDYHALKQHQAQSWAEDTKDLVRLNKIITDQQNVLEQTLKQLQATEQLSLSNRPFKSRLKRAVYGLTVDWVRFKKDRANTKKDH